MGGRILYQDEVEERGLVDLDEVSIPVLEVLTGGGGAVGGGGTHVVGTGLGGCGGMYVLVAVLDYLG